MKRVSLGSFGEVTFPGELERFVAAPSSGEMARLDSEAIQGGISANELMERAGAAVSARIQAAFAGARATPPSAVVLCGPGNNGGDGVVIARELKKRGWLVLCLIADSSRYSPECRAQVAKSCEVVTLEDASENSCALVSGRTVTKDSLAEALRRADLCVDALLGTGQREAPRGAVAELIEVVRREKVRRPALTVVSVDIPTGVNPDTGEVFPCHIDADLTISIELIKRGLLQFPAREACGALEVVSIGINGRDGVEFSLVEGLTVPRCERRSAATHKGAEGRVVVIGGCAEMPGASALAVLGALRAGVGVVYRVSKPTWNAPEIPAEGMNIILPSEAPTYLATDLEQLIPRLREADVVVVGPGLGRSEAVCDFARGLIAALKETSARVVLDADALTIIGTHSIDTRGLNGVMTPHPGEASVLLGRSSSEVQRDRFATVKDLNARYGLVSLLKGAGTLVWDGARGGIIARGTPYLATAGSGDVLAGILAACLKGRERAVFDATIQGAYVHAVAGERASAATGGPIIASDIAWHAAGVLGELTA